MKSKLVKQTDYVLPEEDEDTDYPSDPESLKQNAKLLRQMGYDDLARGLEENYKLAQKLVGSQPQKFDIAKVDSVRVQR